MKSVRPYLILILVAVVLLFAFLVPLPHHVTGEVTIAPHARFDLGFNALGLLESRLTIGGADREAKSTFLQIATDQLTRLELSPLVRDGDAVAIGDTVALLLSTHLSSEIAQAELEVQRLSDQLALLKSPPKREAVKQAESEVTRTRVRRDQTERELKRAKDLREKGLITDEQLEVAQTAFDVAQAESANRLSALQLLKAPPKKQEIDVLEADLQIRQSRLEYVRQQAAAQSFVSPIAGVVRKSGVGKEGWVLSVSDLSQAELHIPVSDFDIALIDSGMAVTTKVRSHPAETFIGHVVHVPSGSELAGASGSFSVTATVANDSRLLVEGVSGFAKIRVGDRTLASHIARKVMSITRIEFWSLW